MLVFDYSVLSLMFDHERHQLILQALQQRSPLSVPELESLLDASPATIRRDLTFLEKLGKLIRTHGGAMHPDSVDGEIPFDRKSRSELKAKLAIAKSAAKLAESGAAVFVDAGSTTLEAGKRLLSMENLTIYTNSIPLLSEPRAANTRLVGIGGEVRSVSMALVGPIALDWLDRVRFDVAFLGTSGIDPAAGPTTTELSEAGVKRAVIRKSRRVAVLADASKWGKPAAIRYADWSQIHDLFTDRSLAAAETRTLRDNNVTVRSTTK